MEIKRKDEAAKVAAGKKKYSVPFKRKAVQEYLVGLKTPTAIFEGYGVRVTSNPNHPSECTTTCRKGLRPLCPTGRW